jgi:septal ring factor EnvC (AmiA/AmiB activator)
MRLPWLVALALAGALFPLPAPAAAEPAKASEAPGLTDEAVAAWVVRLDEAQEKLARTRSRLAADEAALTRARHRRYPRGEALDALKARVAKGRTDLEAAETELPALLEEARRAGVPPGALRRFEPEG